MLSCYVNDVKMSVDEEYNLNFNVLMEFMDFSQNTVNTLVETLHENSMTIKHFMDYCSAKEMNNGFTRSEIGKVVRDGIRKSHPTLHDDYVASIIISMKHVVQNYQ